jgi:hypothetical protein
VNPGADPVIGGPLLTRSKPTYSSPAEEGVSEGKVTAVVDVSVLLLPVTSTLQLVHGPPLRSPAPGPSRLLHRPGPRSPMSP